ncbi:MAG: polymer-forming cytoskeletal protein [Polyangiaceae bacterium]
MAVLGQSTHVRGRVTGSGSIEIAGRVDGEVDVNGDVTVEATGLVGSNVSGRRLVVRGAVKGDLIGAESVSLEDGAKVVGDVRAPRIAIAQGALLRGFVQTAGGGSAPRAKATQAARAVAPPARQSTPRVNERANERANDRAHEKALEKAAEKPAAKPVVHHAPAPKPVAAPAQKAAPKAPPPPVVPALKKGAKGTRVLAGGGKKR